VKIFIHATEPINSLESFYKAMSLGHLPAWITASTFVVTIVGSAALILYASRKRILEEGDFSSYVRNRAN